MAPLPEKVYGSEALLTVMLVGATVPVTLTAPVLAVSSKATASELPKVAVPPAMAQFAVLVFQAEPWLPVQSFIA